MVSFLLSMGYPAGIKAEIKAVFTFFAYLFKKVHQNEHNIYIELKTICFSAVRNEKY